MTNIGELIRVFNEAADSRYTKKGAKVTIREALEPLKELANAEEAQHINKIVRIMKSTAITADQKKQLRASKGPFADIINKYVEEYSEEPNEDDIDDDPTIEQIQVTLDSKIPKYTKYTQQNPMIGVSWDAKRKSYNIEYKNIKTRNKNLDIACQMVINCIGGNRTLHLDNIPATDYFVHSNHYFVCFWHNGEPYFDIQHIISVLNLKTTSWNNKYADFSDEIEYHTWHQNEHGGYILRELIPEQTMYGIILSSESILSKSFKVNVSKILVDLRKAGQLNVTNEKVELVPITEPPSMGVLHRPCTYDSPEDCMYAQDLVYQGSITSLSKYIGRHVLYIFIVRLPTGHNNIIIKIGYTEDIIDRLTTLVYEYKCGFYFLKIKLLSGKKDESNFHKLIKKKYPDLIEQHTIRSKDKIELYKLNQVLIDEFDAYTIPNIPDLEMQPELTDTEKQILDSLKKQQLLLRDNEGILCRQPIPIESDKYFDYLISRDKLNHERYMKQIDAECEREKRMDDIKITELRYANYDKEIELMKMQVKLNYSQHGPQPIKQEPVVDDWRIVVDNLIDTPEITTPPPVKKAPVKKAPVKRKRYDVINL